MRRTATLATLFATSFSFVYADTTSRTTEQQEAAITNPTEECSYYNYAPLNDVVSLSLHVEQLVLLSDSGISEADKQVFASFNASIPNIAPRGTRAGNFTGVSYNYDTDPDCWWTADKCTTPRISGIPDDVTRCEEPNTWGFTLDDGPNCSHNAYYDYLQSIDQKATLFYIGSNVADWPLEGQRGLADGHEICAHTWSHPYMTSMTNEQAFAELYYSKKIIKEMLGVTVRCWRPPYGDVDDRIRYIAQKLDMITIVWEEDTFDYDWSTLGIAAVQKNYENILALQSSGTYNTEGLIVLSHELDNGTMSLSEEFLPKIRQQFTGGVMPVGVCQNNTNPCM
ncbi:family 4 carbohydrate esterase [Meredithblackwellia eburnea MCA 4105]